MPTATNALHLDPATQQDALNLRLTGQSYVSISRVLGLANANAAMYAAEVACNTRFGNTTRIRRFVRTEGDSADMLFLNRNFGIEIEYNRGSITRNPVAIVAEVLRNAGLDAEVESYNHATRTFWKCTTDATVTGGECVSPILNGNQGWIDFRKAMEAIKSVGAEVGRNTGAHVHHDVNDFDGAALTRLANNLQNTEDALLAYVPTHRYNGSNGCGATKMIASEWNEVRRAIGSGYLLPAADRSQRNGLSGFGVTRYRSFNFNSILTYGTVEFRAHGGCLTPFMMRCWVAVGQAIIAYSKAGYEFGAVTDVRPMLDTLVAAGFLRSEMRTRFIKRTEQVATARRRAA